MSYTGNYGGYRRLYDAANQVGREIDIDKSLAGWQQRTIIKRMAIQKMDEEHARIRANFEAEYLPAVAKRKLEPYGEERESVLKIAKDEAEKDLLKTLQGHLKRFEDSLGAPSAEQVRLLQTLALRDDLTPGELATIAGSMSNNLNAMKALRSVAKKSGLDFPRLPTPEEFEESLQQVEDFAAGMIAALGKDAKSLTYDQACFFKGPGIGRAGIIFGEVDNNGFSAARITKAKDSTQEDTGDNRHDTQEQKAADAKAVSKVFCNGSEKLGVVAAQFGVTVEAILEANPGVNFDSMFHGMSFVVPARDMVVSNEPGAVRPDQCIPAAYAEPKSASFKEGETVTV